MSKQEQRFGAMGYTSYLKELSQNKTGGEPSIEAWGTARETVRRRKLGQEWSTRGQGQRGPRTRDWSSVQRLQEEAVQLQGHRGLDMSGRGRNRGQIHGSGSVWGRREKQVWRRGGSV